jgi:hypothetical protein
MGLSDSIRVSTPLRNAGGNAECGSGGDGEAAELLEFQVR